MAQWIRWVVCLIGLGMMAGCQRVPSEGQEVMVVKIISGNTVEVIGADGAIAQRVRLIGITTPPLHQEPWGPAAQKALEQQLQQQRVRLTFDRQTTDDYGRQLGYIWHQGKLINEEMVKQGYALAEEWFPNTQYSQRLQYAQDRARILGLGIWNSEHPMGLTPSQFRHQSPNSSPSP